MNKNEKNKLIADYMELSVFELHGELCYADWDGMHSVKHDSEWNWMMPVVCFKDCSRVPKSSYDSTPRLFKLSDG